jgi:hypothetical protein
MLFYCSALNGTSVTEIAWLNESEGIEFFTLVPKLLGPERDLVYIGCN